MSTRKSVRQQLLTLHESNIRGARMFRASWAVLHHESCIREIEKHPRGPLTRQMRRDVEYFGGLISRAKP